MIFLKENLEEYQSYPLPICEEIKSKKDIYNKELQTDNLTQKLILISKENLNKIPRSKCTKYYYN